jgi:pyruvate dehydrogenase E2 component (dihydrolipoamide acetyltransferase)
MSSLVRMPEILTGMAEAALVSWYIKPGERVLVGQPLAEVETEKALVDYESEAEGTLAGYLVEVGQPVSVGTPIAVLAADGESVSEALANSGVAPGSPTVGTPTQETQAPTPMLAALARVAESVIDSDPSVVPPAQGERRFASPLVRRQARERGIALDAIVGTGPGGRIVRRDLERAATSAEVADVKEHSLAPVATPQREQQIGSSFSDETPSRMRTTIARRLTESKVTVPHFYLEADCEVDRLLELRNEINAGRATKVSVNDFVIKAVAAAFVDVPAANAIWLGDTIRRFSDVDIAVAVAIDDGLVTPVLRQVQTRTLSDISGSVTDLATRARSGQLKQQEIEGGVFAISNLGMFGIERFAAIINPPQAGILAVGRATRRPVVRDEAVTIASVMSVTLSGDHRVLDGALAAQWLRAFVTRIENPLSVLV